MSSFKSIAWLFLLCTGGILAQYKPLLYNFSEIPQHLMVNPGGNPYHNGFIGIPLVSGVYLRGGSNALSMNDLFADNGVNFNIKVAQVLDRMSSRDVIEANEQLELIYIGMKSRKYGSNNFYSAGLYQELDMYLYWPRDLAYLAYQGNAGNLNRPYDLSHLNARGELLTVFHVGIQHQVNRDLSIGGRLKFYSSMFNVTSTTNSGTLVTTEGVGNSIRHEINADMELRTSGVASISNGGFGPFELPKRAYFSGNYGLGVDLGFEYSPDASWTYSGSVLDLGFVLHTSDIESYTLKGEYALEGIEFLFGNSTDEQFLDDYWEFLKDEFEEQIPLDTIRKPYVNIRPVKVYGSVAHHFGNLLYRKKDCPCTLEDQAGYENSVGLQVFALGRPGHLHTAVSAFYYRRVFDFLRVKLSYTADKFSWTNIGVGLSTHFSNFNIYVLGDNVLDYANLAESPLAAVQFGFNYIIPDRSFKGYP